jgi:cell division septation protein DedD
MMNAMPRTPSARGQSIYEVMLILACAAMALALFFAAYEYVSFYHGPTKPYKFEPAASAPPLPRPAARTPAPVAPPTPAPATTAAPAAPTATPGTTAAPATTPSN